MKGIYLIHFDTPLKHAKHYMGYADNIEERLDAHRSGKGSRLMEVLFQEGISWTLARVWEGADRKEERRLKNTHHIPSYCPICRSNGRRKK